MFAFFLFLAKKDTALFALAEYQSISLVLLEVLPAYFNYRYDIHTASEYQVISIPLFLAGKCLFFGAMQKCNFLSTGF
jgi:hypothetical protein